MPETQLVIENLVLPARVGVYDWEQHVRQELVINLVMSFDRQGLGRSDDLASTVDYVRVCERIRHHLETTHCQLIETLAEQLADQLLSGFSLSRVVISLKKPSALPGSAEVSCRIDRPA